MKRDRRVRTPKQARTLLHHAWLHLKLQAVTEENTAQRIAVQDAMFRLAQINLGNFGMNNDCLRWHKERCRQCQVILTHALIDGALWDSKQEQKQGQEIKERYEQQFKVQDDSAIPG